MRRAVVVLVARAAAPQLGDRRLAVVGVGRREVGEHLAAVDALPDEGVVLGRVKRFHDSFWVRNRSMPASRMICGSWPA